ncbi:MAG: S46 family peptidase [Prevotella sp.]|nr:S46 family peptidase [Prevotella sp.]
MRKIILFIASLLGIGQVSADEGMWTLYNLPPEVYDQMCAEGFTMPYEALYNGEHALKNSVVNFSGYCSGVVVSPNGLVFTNHHCGFDAIRSHSTVEHDYLKNGFFAKSYAEELPNEDMFVAFMLDQNDITPRLEAMGIRMLSGEEQESLIDSLTQAMTDSVRLINKSYKVTIEPFYEGNKYYATTYQTFNDVRLVFTIPQSMGKFGGDTDNWMWPRQTCDFSVFRIYADPATNEPADYSKDNVPYHPRHWAPVSMNGYKDGDFSMTVGYPGGTSRYKSSYGIREMRDAENATRAQVRGVKQEVMRRHMRASDAVRIKYDSKYATSANYWKNSIGMNKCIDSIGIINQKWEYEQMIRAYQDSTGYLKGKLDLDKLGKMYKDRFNDYRAFYYLYESLFETSEFAERALKICTGMQPKGPANNEKKQYYQFEDNSDQWDEALDKEVMAAMLENYEANVDSRYLPDFYNEIHNKFNYDYKAFVDYLYKESFLMKPKKKIYFNKKGFADDPGVKYGLDIYAVVFTMRQAVWDSQYDISEQERLLCAAKLKMEQDMPHYSDANFTMRLSYGQVGGYTINGVKSNYYTTAPSLVEKMDKSNENIEYFAEPVMRELMSASDFGQYKDKTTGEMQLCFLTNNDITGGNSGSPMFNGKGELIGLAFDGNWDSLSSDIFFDKELARCIGVDVRFMVYLMDKWGHADRLLQEIGVKN